MRDLIDIVTEEEDAKALRARLRTINSERRHLMALCMDTASRAATALADGEADKHQEEMAKIDRYVRKAAAGEQEAEQILTKLS